MKHERYVGFEIKALSNLMRRNIWEQSGLPEGDEFTEMQGMLLGTDLGGLGTPVASLASLISLKFYIRSPGARPGRFLLWFSAVNFGGLAVLLLLTRVF